MLSTGKRKSKVMRKLFAAHFPWLLAITLVAVLLTRNLWGTRAWIETHDGIFHLIRQEVFTGEIKNGQFPVRWAGTLDNGFGLPLFNYVYPGPYYLGLPLSIIGVSSKWVIKFVEIGLYLLGGFGMYFLFAKIDKFRATVTSLLYLTTPYLLLNIFVRGALGEFMAISLLPWVLLTLGDMSDQKRLLWYHPLPYFFLFIAHNFLSFLFLPIYLLLAYFHRSSWRIILSSFALSLALSAFFVLPMIVERGFLASVASHNFTYNYADHFVYPVQLLFSKWGIGHSYAGLNDGFSFMLGFSNLVVLGLALYHSIFKRKRVVLSWTFITFTTIFFMLPVSLVFWQIIQPIQIIQFPWRLLSLTTIAIPILAFYVLHSRFLALVLITCSLFFAYRYSTPFYFQNNNQLATQLYIHRDKTTTSSRAEMLPKWASVEEKWKGEENLRVESGSAQIITAISTPSVVKFSSHGDTSTVVYRVRRNYFPSWIVRDEQGNDYEVRSTPDAEISFTGLPGLHTYSIYVGSTKTELLANWISLLTLLYILGRGLRPKLKNYLDSHFKDWDISIALRYLPIADALAHLARPSDRILEVGSEITGITPYFKHKITGLDQGFDYTKQNKYLTPVEGSATAIPFKDRSFDYVISVDCIEHIPPRLRAKAIEEMLRVAKKQIYLTFPVGEHSQAIDKTLDNYFYQKNGEHFNYLVEHVDNGLPGFDFVPGIIAQQKGWTLESTGNTSTWLWVLLLKMGLSNVQAATSLYRRLLFLIPLLKHCNFGPCYRQLYTLTRIKS